MAASQWSIQSNSGKAPELRLGIREQRTVEQSLVQGESTVGPGQTRPDQAGPGLHGSGFNSTSE
eukprot:15437090-Alexandrium_andersonii.AAC.1